VASLQYLSSHGIDALRPFEHIMYVERETRDAAYMHYPSDAVVMRPLATGELRLVGSQHALRAVSSMG
jgi:hypothetical protein